MRRLLPSLLAAAGAFLFTTIVFLLAVRAAAARRRGRFHASLGSVVRIATPCRVAAGRALVPGSVGLTKEALAWDAPLGASGSARLSDVRSVESSDRLASGRRLLFARVLRFTLDSGRLLEFVLAPRAEREWRRALGEWAGREDALQTT